jgi:cytoskeletal protein RodZ
MSEQESKKKLVGPWRSIHAAVWLIGLAILFWTGNWWPGILVLIAISGIVEALIRRYAPDAVEAEEPASLPSASTETSAPQPVESPSASAPREHRLELLPSICPGCGGPIRGHEVK